MLNKLGYFKKEPKPFIPCIGINIETFLYSNIIFDAIDVGECKIFWDLNFDYCSGLIFIVDSSDPYSFDSANLELHKLLQETLFTGLPLLILANKQYLPGAKTIEEVIKELELEKIKEREWRVMPTCMESADGLYEAI